MQQTREYKPGKNSLLLSSFVLGIMLLLGLGVQFTPSKDDSSKVLGCVLLVLAILLGALFGYMRSKTRIILNPTDFICRSLQGNIQIPCSSIISVSGTVISGSKTDSEYVLLKVLGLEELIQKNPALRNFCYGGQDQIRLMTSLYDEGAGQIIEEIRGRLLSSPTTPIIPSLPRTSLVPLPLKPAITHRAWLSLMPLAIFGLFASFGIYIFITQHTDIGAIILSVIFLLTFGPLTVLSVIILVVEKIQIKPHSLLVCYPSLTMEVAWSDITGICSAGDSRSKILIVQLADFQTFRKSLPPSQEAKLLNMLVGRGEGLPIKRDMLAVSLNKIEMEIRQRTLLNPPAATN